MCRDLQWGLTKKRDFITNQMVSCGSITLKQTSKDSKVAAFSEILLPLEDCTGMKRTLSFGATNSSFTSDASETEGEIGRGAKRRADNFSVRNKNHSRLYFHTRRTPSPTTAIILIPYPNPFRDSLHSSQIPSPTFPRSTVRVQLPSSCSRPCLSRLGTM